MIANVLREAEQKLGDAGVADGRLEAQLLMGLASGLGRTGVLCRLSDDLPANCRRLFWRLVDLRITRTPLAYLRGTQEFFGIEFDVDPNVLIPRPETELLVDFALETLQNHPAPRVADIGTGSGCIAIAVAAHARHATVLARDVSIGALRIARLNSRRAEVEVRFEHANLLSGLAPDSLDLVLSNLPYIPTCEVEALQPEVRDHEPRMALDGGEDGLDLIRTLVGQARDRLAPGGWIALEVALGQGRLVADLLTAGGYECTDVRSDLAGIGRVVVGRKPGELSR